MIEFFNKWFLGQFSEKLKTFDNSIMIKSTGDFPHFQDKKTNFFIQKGILVLILGKVWLNKG